MVGKCLYNVREAGSGVPPTYKELGVAYIATSTTHGVPHIFLARGKCKSIFWVMCLLLGATALIVNLTFLVMKYVQFLPSTRITVQQNPTLAFPAVTICNTNPIKSSAIGHSPRLVALLESWGVINTGNSTRKKRHVVSETDAFYGEVHDSGTNHHYIAKRSTISECNFLKMYNTTEGLVSLCEPHIDITNTSEAGCLQEACNLVNGGQNQYNVINFQDGVLCSVHACSLPFNDSTLMLSSTPPGNNIYAVAYNECVSDPCPHGQCEDTDLYYICICDGGYTGVNCETEIDECESQPCKNGGTCQDLINRYNCSCMPGFTAIDCSLVTSGYNKYENTLCSGEALLTSVNVSVTECEDLCDDTLACIAFTYIPTTQNCSIKGQCSTMEEQENITAYVKFTPTHGYSVFVNRDCSGNDIKPSTSRTSAWDCHRECDEVVSCVAFVFVESLQKCSIKSECDTSSLTTKDSSGGYGVYLKTGKAGICSWPRARLPCPGSFENITEQECNSLSEDCCYENSQTDVSWCYLDTLDSLHHNHIHTVFRAAEKVPSSPVLYDLWVGNSFTPSLESEVTSNYFSIDGTETEVYKAPIVQCSWWRATKVYIMVHSNGEEKMYFQFNDKDKISWFSDSQLTRSTYTDASSSTTYENFGIEGQTTDGVRRRWFIYSQYGGCTYDSGWFVVLDKDHSGTCNWDNESDLPVFMYSGTDTEDVLRRFLFAETFFIKIKFDDYSLGGECVSSCIYLSDGNYQSCMGCNVYVVCSSEVMTYHVCHKAQRFDGYSRKCKDYSYTCFGDKVSGSCIPQNECETNTQCLNGGTCNIASEGWECLCVNGYTGRYCQKCADFTSGTDLYGTTQLVLSWTPDNQGTMYADGLEIASSSDWSEVIQTNLPCGTLIATFALTHTSGGTGGFLASYGDSWNTGDENLKCTSDASLALTNDWKVYDYDDSAWQVPTILMNHGDGSWGTLDHISSAAKWVWTNDMATQIYCRLYMCTDVEPLVILADDQVEVFADGISVRNVSYNDGMTTFYVPCNTNQLAFKVLKGSTSKGLLMKHGSLWVTGDEDSILCSSSGGLAVSDHWKYSGFDTSSWQTPTVVPHSLSPPSEFGSAQWVWTDDEASTIYCVDQIIEPTTTTVTTTESTTIETTTAFNFYSSFQERNENPPTEDFLREEDILTLMASLDEDTKRKLGYSLNDLVSECDFGGQTCTEGDFDWFFDAVYGNCYVFNSRWEEKENATTLNPTQQGSRHGLTVVLDIGQYEYIPDVGEAAGAVVVVHDPDDMPFPEDEGIQAVPGKLTSVGIRKIDISRLPDPHGDCEQNLERNHTRSLFEDLHPVKYSVSSCFKTCYQKYVVETCGCGDPQYPIEGQVFAGIEVIPCNARNITQDDCKYGVTKKYINDELDCSCPNPCQDTTYEYKVSSADWPALVNEAKCFSEMQMKLAAKGITGLTDAQLKSNMVKIQVFYESLNSENLFEYPAYRLAKLFWDIGGILGLWLGCSVLSIMELLELGLDALILLCYKITKKKYWALPVKSRNTANKEKSFDDISKEDNIVGQRTNKKVKISKDGKLTYTYNGQIGKGFNNSEARQRKLALPGHLLAGSELW